MGLGSAVFTLFVLSLSLGRIALGIWLFTESLPLRDNARLRVPATLLCLMAVYALVSFATYIPLPTMTGLSFSLAQLVTFSLLLVACVDATMAVYDTNVWTALFCCSAGYTLQNLASGTVELVWSLLGGGAPGTPGFFTPPRLAVSLLCTAAVYVVAYLSITRYLRREGLGRIEDRRMLVMFALTILVIIGFDLVIKWLVEQGVATGAMVLLRCFHGLACAFTLTMEFELLVRRRTEAERDTLTQVLAEHDRQYESARGTIAAVDARMHDIRHAVGRIADADGLPREAVRDLVREVNLYDARVRTGNEALDTALTERGLRLRRKGGRLSCVADGAALAFMAPADTYSLLTTLLDMVPDDNAEISLAIRMALGTASLHIEWASSGSQVDMPEAARAITARYGGALTTLERDGRLHVNVLFPGQG